MQQHSDNTNDRLKDTMNWLKANMAILKELIIDIFIKLITATSSFVDDNLDNFVLSTIAKQEENNTNFHLYINSKVDNKGQALYYAFINSDMPVAFATIMQQFNSILDSDCTTHIIKKKVFLDI